MVELTLKLDIEIFKLLLVTLALLILRKYRPLFEASLPRSLVRKGAYVTVIFWLGFLADVMNDVYPTPFTKILDDIIISFALLLGVYYLIDHMQRAKVNLVPAMVLNGESSLKRGAYLFPRSDVSSLLKLTAGKKVVALTRTPGPFKSRRIPYLWLSKVESENSIDPLRLPAILHHLVSTADGDTVVILDGIEYLILENGFNTVLKSLTSLKDNLLLKGATAVVVVNPEALDKAQLAALEREFEVLNVEK